MIVDSFKYLPRLIRLMYESIEITPDLPIPWTQLSKPISQSKFGLITSAGFYQLDQDSPFDIEREKKDPAWGDPSFRVIPSTISQENLGISHLHVNTIWAKKDLNVLLPIHRFKELALKGVVGSLAQDAYSFMGYQGYPSDTTSWKNIYARKVAKRFEEQGVDCILLVPS